MPSPIAQIYGDEVGATFTVPTSDFSTFPGSTKFVAQTMDIRYIKPDRDHLSFVTGQDGKGTWLAEWAASFSGSAGNQTYHIALFKNSSRMGPTSIERKIGTGGDIGAASSGGYVVLKNSTDIVDFRVESETSGVKMTVKHLSFRMSRVTSSTALVTV